MLMSEKRLKRGRPTLPETTSDPKGPVDVRASKRARLHALRHRLAATQGRKFTLDDSIGFLLDFYATYRGLAANK